MAVQPIDSVGGSHQESAHPTPSGSFSSGLAFWGSKTLLSAIELGVFATWRRRAGDAADLRVRLGLHPRGARDFFDALVALGMLDGVTAIYDEHPVDRSLPRPAKPRRTSAACSRWRTLGCTGSGARLTDGLRTGQPQNEARVGGELLRDALRGPGRAGGFLHAMTGLSTGAAHAIAAAFPGPSIRPSSTSDARRAACSAGARPGAPHLTRRRLRPAGGPADLRGVRGVVRRRRPHDLHRRRLLRRRAPLPPTCS